MSLVQIANNSGQTVWQRLLQLDAERERNHKLVGENQRLEKELEQTKLELKLERQNKLASNKQKSADVEQDPQTAATSSEEKTEKKKGAPVGHVSSDAIVVNLIP